MSCGYLAFVQIPRKKVAQIFYAFFCVAHSASDKTLLLPHHDENLGMTCQFEAGKPALPALEAKNKQQF